MTDTKKNVPVTIGAETGERVTIERNVVSEHVVYRSDVAAWPRDTADQRVWALSLVSQKLVPLFKTENDLGELFAAAERVVDWVNTGRDDG